MSRNPMNIRATSQLEVSLHEYRHTLTIIGLMKVSNLKDLARALGLMVGGKKSELFERILSEMERFRRNQEHIAIAVVRVLVVKILQNKPLPRFTPLCDALSSGTFRYTPEEVNVPEDMIPRGTSMYRPALESTGQPVGHSTSSDHRSSGFVFPSAAVARQESHPYKGHVLYFRESPFYRLKRMIHGAPQIALPCPTRGTSYHKFVLNEWETSLLFGNGADLPGDFECLILCGIANQKSASTSSAYIQFPHPVELRVNGVLVKDGVKGIKNKLGTATPAKITKLIKKSPLLNQVEMVYLDTKEAYLFYCYIVEKVPPSEILSQVLSNSHIHYNSTTTQIQREYAGMDDDNNEDDDDDIIVATQSISLRDPVTRARLSHPCRSIFCNHVQCFDALAFIELQAQVPTWQCPICNRDINVKDLAISDYYQEILRNTDSEVDSVSLLADGSWEVIKEPERGEQSRPQKEVKQGSEDASKPAASMEPEIEIISLDSESEDEESGQQLLGEQVRQEQRTVETSPDQNGRNGQLQDQERELLQRGQQEEEQQSENRERENQHSPYEKTESHFQNASSATTEQVLPGIQNGNGSTDRSFYNGTANVSRPGNFPSLTSSHPLTENGRQQSDCNFPTANQTPSDIYNFRQQLDRNTSSAAALQSQLDFERAKHEAALQLAQLRGEKEANFDQINYPLPQCVFDQLPKQARSDYLQLESGVQNRLFKDQASSVLLQQYPDSDQRLVQAPHSTDFAVPQNQLLIRTLSTPQAPATPHNFVGIPSVSQQRPYYSGNSAPFSPEIPTSGTSLNSNLLNNPPSSGTGQSISGHSSRVPETLKSKSSSAGQIQSSSNLGNPEYVEIISSDDEVDNIPSSLRPVAGSLMSNRNEGANNAIFDDNNVLDVAREIEMSLAGQNNQASSAIPDDEIPIGQFRQINREESDTYLPPLDILRKNRVAGDRDSSDLELTPFEELPLASFGGIRDKRQNVNGFGSQKIANKISAPSSSEANQVSSKYETSNAVPQSAPIISVPQSKRTEEGEAFLAQGSNLESNLDQTSNFIPPLVSSSTETGVGIEGFSRPLSPVVLSKSKEASRDIEQRGQNSTIGSVPGQPPTAESQRIDRLRLEAERRRKENEERRNQSSKHSREQTEIREKVRSHVSSNYKQPEINRDGASSNNADVSVTMEEAGELVPLEAVTATGNEGNDNILHSEPPTSKPDKENFVGILGIAFTPSYLQDSFFRAGDPANGSNSNNHELNGRIGDMSLSSGKKKRTILPVPRLWNKRLNSTSAVQSEINEVAREEQNKD